MKEQKDILTKIDRHDGMTVPEGYFEGFAARMASSLPVTSFEESAGNDTAPIRPTLWHRIRPYVYMAAMFGGVWCMLKMFTMLSTPAEINWEPSPVMAEALGNDVFVNEYILNGIDELDLMEDMVDCGFDLSTLNDSIEYDDEGIGDVNDDNLIGI